MKFFYRIGLLLLFFGLLLALGGCSGNEGDEELKSFALCLTENDATLYGLPSCPACQEQRDKFGGAFEYVNYVDCDSKPETCRNMGVGRVPLWIIDGNRYTGVRSLEELADVTGCEVDSGSD